MNSGGRPKAGTLHHVLALLCPRPAEARANIVRHLCFGSFCARCYETRSASCGFQGGSGRRSHSRHTAIVRRRGTRNEYQGSCGLLPALITIRFLRSPQCTRVRSARGFLHINGQSRAHTQIPVVSGNPPGTRLCVDTIPPGPICEFDGAVPWPARVFLSRLPEKRQRRALGVATPAPTVLRSSSTRSSTSEWKTKQKSRSKRRFQGHRRSAAVISCFSFQCSSSPPVGVENPFRQL